jgi:hypothetical protein
VTQGQAEVEIHLHKMTKKISSGRKFEEEKNTLEKEEQFPIKAFL